MGKRDCEALKMGGHTGQWLLLAVLSAALCTPIMADPGHFEPEPAEVSAHHKRTAWPDVQEGEAGPSGRRRRKQKSPGQTKSPTRSPTKSPTRSPTKSPTLDPCDADFKSTPPTCPNGYSVTVGSLVDKQTKEHGVCIMIQSVLCQCGSSGSGCPKAEKPTGLQCCKAPSVISGGLSIHGSHQWEDTPTRCTLGNPLVQSFYSNAGSLTWSMDRNSMATRPEEVTQLKQHVHPSLVAAFPGKPVALRVEGNTGMSAFWIVIGVGQRAKT